MKMGIERIIEESVANVVAVLKVAAEARVFGETPIERLFATALIARVHFFESRFQGTLFPAGADELAGNLGDATCREFLIVAKQQQLPTWRVDFIVYAYNWLGEPGGWRRLIVECDGHAFHERTREQARKDRSRDRSVQLEGIPVFRFTGSELWRDPMSCAEQVHQWAAKGLA